jgi:hypothetical protein
VDRLVDEKGDMSASNPRLRRWHKWSAIMGLAFLGQVGMACAEEAPCLANCARGSSCKLSEPLGSRPDGSPVRVDDRLALTDSSLKQVQDCFSRSVVAGDVMVRYRHQNRMFMPPAPIAKDSKLRALLNSHPPDKCSLPSPKCLDQAMFGLKAALGGHGIDGQPSEPAGRGQPCTLGLPCGTVIPPAAAWRFRLVEDGFDGVWRARALRGQPPAGKPVELQAEVAGGTVAADGSWFAPGVTYSYALYEKGGSIKASGEFTVQSSAQYAALRRLVDRRIEAGLSEPSAWLDALVANQLDWDAIQRLNP